MTQQWQGPVLTRQQARLVEEAALMIADAARALKTAAAGGDEPGGTPLTPTYVNEMTRAVEQATRVIRQLVSEDGGLVR